MTLQNFSKPFAQSCEENKHVILEAIQPFLKEVTSVLEIASGTGQHAIYFADRLPHLTWQTSDVIECHPGIQKWIADASIDNILLPFSLSVSEDTWPQTRYDAVYSANSFHIMSQQNVEDFFGNLNQVLNPNAVIVIYGPFNYQGSFTSDSNARFNAWLTQRDPNSGIKDFEWCNQLAEKAGLSLRDDITMPQNNRLLVWQAAKLD